MRSTPHEKRSSAAPAVIPRPPEMFSPLTITQSRRSSRLSTGTACTTASCPLFPTISPRKRTFIEVRSSGDLRRARFPDDGDFDLAGILHALFDLLAHVARDTHRVEV